MLLHRQVDQQYGLSEQIAACFTDHRDPSRVEHSLQELVAQRLYGLVQGYEDLNDHDISRNDVMLSVAVGKLARRRGEGYWVPISPARDDETHGAQEGAEFNGYYQSTCYTPLYLFCGRDLLAARLRPANVDPEAGALEELQRVIAAIQAQWPEVKIWVWGYSAYSRDDAMSWCEATPNVDYLFAQGSNAVLVRWSTRWSEAALQDYAQRRQQAQTT